MTTTSDALSVPTDRRNSVEKAVAVLDAFAGPGATRSLLEVARRAGLPKPTAHRLLALLVRQRLVVRVGPAYALGNRLFEMGNMVPACRPRQLRETAMPMLCDLRAAVGSTVHLAVLDDLQVLYIEKLPSGAHPALPTVVGQRQPLHATALGKAMLAHLADDVVDAVAARPLARFTPHTVTTSAGLRTQLARTRHEGVATDVEERVPGLRCAAVPILLAEGRSRRVIGAVSVSSFRGHSTAAVAALRQTAAAIGHRLVGA